MEKWVASRYDLLKISIDSLLKLAFAVRQIIKISWIPWLFRHSVWFISLFASSCHQKKAFEPNYQPKMRYLRPSYHRRSRDWSQDFTNQGIIEDNENRRMIWEEAKDRLILYYSLHEGGEIIQTDIKMRLEDCPDIFTLNWQFFFFIYVEQLPSSLPIDPSITRNYTLSTKVSLIQLLVTIVYIYSSTSEHIINILVTGSSTSLLSKACSVHTFSPSLSGKSFVSL